MDGDSVNIDMIAPLLQGPEFDHAILTLKTQMLDDPLANELGSTYDDQIRSLAQETDMDLGEFACGLTLCLGIVHASNDDAAAWEGLQTSLRQESGLPIYTFGNFTSVDAGAEIEHRFFFTTDPASEGASGSLRP